MQENTETKVNFYFSLSNQNLCRNCGKDYSIILFKNNLYNKNQFNVHNFLAKTFTQ